MEGKRGRGKKRRARTDGGIIILFIFLVWGGGGGVVLHSSVLERVQASACVGRVTTDSDRS